MAAPYVALGDSYAAGVGGGPPGDLCFRSRSGYPVLVAQRLGLDLAYQACIGATVEDVERHQLAALGSDSRLVTISVGGNDIGFVPVIIACAEPSWMRDSDPVIDAAEASLRQDLPGRLDRVLGEIQQRAPAAQVLLTGYPRIFAGVDCNALTFFSAHEMTRLDRAADDLAETMAAAAARAGVAFVDVRPEFLGHAVCAEQEWINGVNIPIEGSFHPNALGHQAYATLVAPRVDPMLIEPAAGAAPAVQPGPCIRGSAPTFSLPDLAGARSREGAAAYGLDPDEVAHLGERVRATGDPAAADRLHMMDARVRSVRASMAT